MAGRNRPTIALHVTSAGRPHRHTATVTWRLNQEGKPDELFRQIMALTDEALRLNPSLAEAHVPRARALLRAGKEEEAKAAIDSALALDPRLTGAFFLRAEVFRRRMQLAQAESWYLKFIDGTPSAARRSNAYYWMAYMYETAAWKEPRQWTAHITKARGAYEKMVEFDPRGAWKLVNFAAFLNDEAADFPAAEKYARRALDVMDFPAARYQWAFARYQALQAEIPKMSDATLKTACEDISQATGVTLDEAITQSSRYRAISGRLEIVRARLAPRAAGGKATWR